jgi:hypothetical protein
MKQVNNECCPKFNLEKWNDKMFVWNKKKFIKTSVPTFFRIPFPPMIGKKMTRIMEIAENADKLTENKEDILMLFSNLNTFKSELYLSVTGDIPNSKNTTISGVLISKVFDGAYKDLPKYIKQMSADLRKQNKEAKKYYVHYAYCPKCTKKFGHNYMVLFAEV